MAAKTLTTTTVLALMGSRILIERFKKHLDLFNGYMSNWNTEYCDAFIQRIDQSMLDDLGFNTRNLLKQATFDLLGVFEQIKIEISILNVTTFDDIIKKFR